MRVSTALLALFCIGRLWGEANTWKSGEDWLRWDTLAKAVYIGAVDDTAVSVANTAAVIASEKLGKQDLDDIQNLPLRYFPNATVTTGTLIKSLDHFYAEPDNRGIRIVDAMQIVAARINGATERCLGEMLIEGRLTSAQAKPEKIAAQHREAQRICSK